MAIFFIVVIRRLLSAFVVIFVVATSPRPATAHRCQPGGGTGSGHGSAPMGRGLFTMSKSATQVMNKP